MELNNITRRDAIRILASAGLLSALPKIALGVDQSDVDKTNAQLSEAQKQADEAQKQLDTIASQYEKLSEKQSKTLDQIEDTQDKISEVEDDIDKKQKELDQKKEQLSKRMAENYKSGNQGVLDVLLSSSSFEELESNVYYMDKISESDSKMIQQVKTLRNQLQTQKDELETQKSQLEDLSATQKTQMEQMEAKQQETQDVLDGLNSQVQDLMNQRDAELEAMAKEKAEQEAAAAAAAAKAKAQSSPSGSSGSSNSGSSSSAGSGSSGGAGNVTGEISDNGSRTGSQQAVVSACHSTPSPGAGLCAMWVSQVFNNAGLGYASGNACDMYNAWCTSSNRAALKPGMIVAVSSHSHTSAGRIYGHIGIYVGGGMMMDNIGYIRTIDVNSWISFYGTTVTPRWGWLMGIKLA